MINDFNDFCLWRSFVVVEIWLRIAPFFKRRGPPPNCPDSDLLAMALIAECRGWAVETEMLSYWQEHRDLFPNIPTQSRFNRRRRGLMQAFNLIRRVILQSLDVAQDRQCVIDSLPLPVMQFYLVPSSSGDWKASGSTFGKVLSRKQNILGYKAYISTAKAAQLWQENRIQLRTIPRRNQRKQLPLFLQHLYNSIRQMVETV